VVVAEGIDIRWSVRKTSAQPFDFTQLERALAILSCAASTKLILTSSWFASFWFASWLASSWSFSLAYALLNPSG
jgi:hypothetical protein